MCEVFRSAEAELELELVFGRGSGLAWAPAVRHADDMPDDTASHHNTIHTTTPPHPTPILEANIDVSAHFRSGLLTPPSRRYRHARMPRRPPLPRSPPSSSSASVACRRRPTSPRQAVSCLLGTFYIRSTKTRQIRVLNTS